MNVKYLYYTLIIICMLQNVHGKKTKKTKTRFLKVLQNMSRYSWLEMINCIIERRTMLTSLSFSFLHEFQTLSNTDVAARYKIIDKESKKCYDKFQDNLLGSYACLSEQVFPTLYDLKDDMLKIMDLGDRFLWKFDKNVLRTCEIVPAYEIEKEKKKRMREEEEAQRLKEEAERKKKEEEEQKLKEEEEIRKKEAEEKAALVDKDKKTNKDDKKNEIKKDDADKQTK